MTNEIKTTSTKKAKSFVLYDDIINTLKLLDTNERGMLFTLICNYVNDGKDTLGECGSSPKVDIAFSFIRAQLERDLEKYEAICRRNAENGKKGGRPKKFEKAESTTENNASVPADENPEKPKKAYNNTNNNNNNNYNNNNNNNTNTYSYSYSNTNSESDPRFAGQKRSFRPTEKEKEKEKRNWNEDRERAQRQHAWDNIPASFSSFDTDDFFEAALRRSYMDTD